MSLKCSNVASYIIDEVYRYNMEVSVREKVLLSTKRLQKLLYFSEVLYMKNNNGRRLFEDDFEAWASGPVIEDIFIEFMLETPSWETIKSKPLTIELSKREKEAITSVVKSSRKMDTVELSLCSRVEGGPWDAVYDSSSDITAFISKRDMYEFYRNRDIFDKTPGEKPKTKKLTLFDKLKK